MSTSRSAASPRAWRRPSSCSARIVHEPRLIVLDEPFSGPRRDQPGPARAPDPRRGGGRARRSSSRPTSSPMPSGCASGSRSSPAARSASRAGRRGARPAPAAGPAARPAPPTAPWRAALPADARSEDGVLAVRAARERHRAAAQGADRRRRRDRGRCRSSAPGLHDAFVAIAGEAGGARAGPRAPAEEKRHDAASSTPPASSPAATSPRPSVAHLHLLPARAAVLIIGSARLPGRDRQRRMRASRRHADRRGGVDAADVDRDRRPRASGSARPSASAACRAWSASELAPGDIGAPDPRAARTARPSASSPCSAAASTGPTLTGADEPRPRASGSP